MLALVALAPVLLLFWALAVRRWPGHLAAGAALFLALALAVVAFRMPPGLALLSVAHGMAFGLWPIGWIVIAAVFLYELVVATGELEVVKAAFSAATPDRRVQALLVAYGLGALLEGAAGFGTPIAIAGAMLAALGFEPVLAASLALVSNAAGVALGAVGIGIEVAGNVSGLEPARVGELVGRTVPLLALGIPFVLTTLVAGARRGLEAWPAALAAGLAFALVQGLVANLIGAPLADLAGGLAALCLLVLLARHWRPAEPFRFPGDPPPTNSRPPSAARVLRAFSPFVLLAVTVTAWNLRPVRDLLGRATLVLAVPGLDGAVLRDGVPVRALWRFDVLAAGGTAVVLAAILSAIALGASRAELRAVLHRGGVALPRPVLTVALVLGFAYLMNSSGMAAALGGTLAATGHLFPLFSPVLGWLGVMLTGSNTSSNALFGQLQKVTATRVGLEPLVAVSGNALGGACAQMMTPQGLAVATAGIHALAGQEGAVLRRTLPRSLCALAATAALSALVAGPLARLVPGPHAPAGAALPSALSGWLLLFLAALAATAIGLAARRAGRAP